jgi:hypothetical protein
MTEAENAVALDRAKRLAKKYGFSWELDFGAPGIPALNFGVSIF